MPMPYQVSQLDELPRAALCHTPTPLMPLPRLSEELGGPLIWVKRDDCTGLATGGNKARKLEFLLGAAQAEKSEQVVTFGAVQSNHARQTAAACAQLGLPCHLMLSRQVPSSEPRYEVGGNITLNKLFNANIEFFDVGEDDRFSEYLNHLKEQQSTYVIPAGGSNATGSLGYVSAAVELANQCQAQGVDLNHVVHASASSGTQAGLIAGMQAIGVNPEITGINVFHSDPAHLVDRVTQLVEKVHDQYQIPRLSSIETTVNHAYLGQGYGQLNEETKKAIQLTARTEGLLFDPVYSGKALAALIDQITIGAYTHLHDVILIHTGGTSSLNVYESEFSNS